MENIFFLKENNFTLIIIAIKYLIIRMQFKFFSVHFNANILHIVFYIKQKNPFITLHYYIIYICY